ncbi:MAG: LacI family DNA-binding transcriptional regulator [Ktedonobacteraceae bacterium]|nr:LacI family DNA-binding transcriptional regulator [Ktedonobacteraceae bacterium]
MTTIYDIAKAVGVTQTTVANALAGRGNVSEATRKRILQCAQDMGYRPNVLARGLAKGKTSTIGFLLPTIANPFYPEIAEEIERITHVHDYQLLLCNTHHDYALGRQNLERLVSRWVDGIIVMGSSMDLVDLVHQFEHGLPIVLCNWQENEPSPGIPQVNVDFRLAGELAAHHLLALGHQKIAIIVDEPQQTTRFAGFRAALLSAGIPLQDEMIQLGDSTIESGHAAARTLLTSPQRPTAIFATNDWMAIGALEAAREEGIRVPEDLSIIGLDNVIVGAHISPPLTTIDIPKHQLAKKATELLMRQIDGDRDQAQSILIPPELLIRHSTAVPSSATMGDAPSLPVR